MINMGFMNKKHSLVKGIALIIWSLFSCLNCLAQDLSYIDSLNKKGVKSTDIEYLMDETIIVDSEEGGLLLIIPNDNS